MDLGKTVFFAPLPSVAILNLSLSALKREGGREGGVKKDTLEDILNCQ
jgi:hypothetical protein